VLPRTPEKSENLEKTRLRNECVDVVFVHLTRSLFIVVYQNCFRNASGFTACEGCYRWGEEAESFIARRRSFKENIPKD
jgi:hypothetical protein